MIVVPVGSWGQPSHPESKLAFNVRAKLVHHQNEDSARGRRKVK